MRALVAIVAAVSVLGCEGASDRQPTTTTLVAAKRTPEAERAAAKPVDNRPNRPLTASEVALLRPLFGSSVPYSDIRVFDGKFVPFQPDDVYMTPEGNIYAPGHLFRDDFSGDGVSPGIKAVFVHEIAHVWQHANGLNLLFEGIAELARRGGDYGAAYAYALAEGNDLLDYGIEQQASILEDYFRVRYQGSRPSSLRNDVPSREARTRLYAAVLGRFLVDPVYARSAAARERVARRAGKAPEPPTGVALIDPAESADEHHANRWCGWRHSSSRVRTD